MTTRQESKLSMYLAVKDFLTTNTAIATPLPNYTGFFTSFQNGIAQIQTYSEQQMFDKTGLSKNKEILRNTLVMLACDTSRKMQAYAKYANNQLLLTETKFTESDLKKVADNELRDRAQGIYDRAQTNLTALSTYSVTAATQTSLQSAITSFVTAIPKPRLGITDKKLSTAQLANYFAVVDDALDNIDMIIDIVKLTQQNFYNGYKAARKIVGLGTGSLAVKGFVHDAKNGAPLKGATLNFVLTDGEALQKSSKAVAAIMKKTAEKGGFNIKSMPAGMYTVTIKKTGYADQVLNVAVADGDLTGLNIEMEKK